MSMGKRLYKAARGPKELILYKANVHHNAVGVFKEPKIFSQAKTHSPFSIAYSPSLGCPRVEFSGPIEAD